VGDNPLQANGTVGQFEGDMSEPFAGNELRSTLLENEPDTPAAHIIEFKKGTLKGNFGGF